MAKIFGKKKPLEERIVNAVVAAPQRETYDPPEAMPAPSGPPNPPKRNWKTKLALLGGAGLILLGGIAGAYALLSGRQQYGIAETPTPTAYLKPTPTIDASYYKPQNTPTPIPTSTPLMIVWPTPTPRPIPIITPYFFPTEEPMETPTSQKTPTPVPTITPMPGLENILTEQQIVEYATGWQKPQLITPELLQQIDAVNLTLYYKLTGKTFESRKFVTRLLTDDEWSKLHSNDWNGTISTETLTGVTYVDVRSRIGKKIPVIDVFKTLAHETGNAEAEKIDVKRSQIGLTDLDTYHKFLKEVAEKYELGELSDVISTIERESLQTLYRGAAFHKLEELGVTIGTPLSQKDINDTVDAIVTSQHFNPQASVVAWRRALKNPDTAAALQKNGKITSQQSINLFYEYAQKAQTKEGLEQTVVEIVNAIRTAQDYASQIKEAAILSQRPAGFMLYFP